MSPGAWQETGSVANRKRGEEGGGENSLERQGSSSNRRDVKWLYRSGRNKGRGRVERKSSDVPTERSRDYQRKVEAQKEIGAVY